MSLQILCGPDTTESEDLSTVGKSSLTANVTLQLERFRSLNNPGEYDSAIGFGDSDFPQLNTNLNYVNPSWSPQTAAMVCEQLTRFLVSCVHSRASSSRPETEQPKRYRIHGPHFSIPLVHRNTAGSGSDSSGTIFQAESLGVSTISTNSAQVSSMDFLHLQHAQYRSELRNSMHLKVCIVLATGSRERLPQFFEPRSAHLFWRIFSYTH